MRVTRSDIAQRAQVSNSLVSKVLNNREVRISEAEKRLILRIANEMGYTSNRLPAQAMEILAKSTLMAP